jgi:hypothetical protein
MPYENVGTGGDPKTLTNIGQKVELENGAKVEFSPGDCSFEMTTKDGDRINLSSFVNVLREMADHEDSISTWLGDSDYGRGDKF